VDALIVIGVLAAVAGMVAGAVFRTRRRSAARDEKRTPAPWSRSEKLSLAGILVGAGIGIAGFVSSGDGEGDGGRSQATTRHGPNPMALAALIRQGPFTERLPDPLEASGLRDVNIADASAANRVDAVQLKARYPADALSSFFAHLEVYRSEDAAFDRAQARIREIKEIFGPEVIRGSSESYCAYLDQEGTWECGGSRGAVYAEATVSPNANAYQHYATGSASALLDYAEEKARVAAD
jgi:hypothetical protein